MSCGIMSVVEGVYSSAGCDVVCGPVAGQVSEGSAETNPKRRACEPEFGNGTETMFADGYPYLLATEASSHPLMRL